ncbi:MAG: hypothetical protein KF832_27330 [Caldilineaceae bacterium]|nr:hypothetical protein [Caldilineaceae bacterium]
MIYQHTFNGLPVQTGDIICTRNGTDYNWFGHFWRWVGYLVPGQVDHTALYIGPGGRCIEAVGKGVIDFEMPGTRWDAPRVAATRLLHDTLLGVAYPLQGLPLDDAAEEQIRTFVAEYCLAQVGKPYNVNFLNTVTDAAFYCSQLIYLAYREAGVDLGALPVCLQPKVAEEAQTAPLLILPTQLLDNSPHQLVGARRLWRRSMRKATPRSQPSPGPAK